MITAKVELTQSLRQQRQFVAQTGSGHHLLLDDAAGEPAQSRLNWSPPAWRGARHSTL